MSRFPGTTARSVRSIRNRPTLITTRRSVVPSSIGTVGERARSDSLGLAVIYGNHPAGGAIPSDVRASIEDRRVEIEAAVRDYRASGIDPIGSVDLTVLPDAVSEHEAEAVTGPDGERINVRRELPGRPTQQHSFRPSLG